MSKSKSWPDEGETVCFRDLAEPVCEAIRFAYSLSRRNKRRSVPWTGYNIGKHELACCLPPHRVLMESQLRQDGEQGRDALQGIVGIAVQLGIEQGRRMERERNSIEDDLVRLLAEGVLENLRRKGK